LSFIQLENVRETLRIPTEVAADLARRAGARVCRVRIGRVEIIVPGSSIRIQIGVRPKNVFAKEAMAYRLAGLPVPAQVLQDMERWEREHGGHST